jgi:hypothetical protein
MWRKRSIFAPVLLSLFVSLQGCGPLRKGTTTLLERDGDICKVSSQVTNDQEPRRFSAVLQCEPDVSAHDGSMKGSTHYRNYAEDSPSSSCKLTTLDCGDKIGPHSPTQKHVSLCEHDEVEKLLKQLCADTQDTKVAAVESKVVHDRVSLRGPSLPLRHAMHNSAHLS